jgi:hypothetical protein
MGNMYENDVTPIPKDGGDELPFGLKRAPKGTIDVKGIVGHVPLPHSKLKDKPKTTKDEPKES